MREILDREDFVNLHSNEKGIRKVITEPDAFGVDPEKGFVHARGLARIIKAWTDAKAQAEAMQHVDNVAKAHGEPTTMLRVVWMTLLDRFKENMESTCTTTGCLLTHTMKLSKRSDGQLSAETLAHVVSLQDELEQKAKHPEPTRQLGLHLDSSMTIQTKRVTCQVRRHRQKNSDRSTTS